MRKINENEYSKELLGTKGYNLYLMEKAGLNVPKFICISNDGDENITDGLEDITYSVRSSSSYEDSSSNSFAGQFKTYLDINKDSIVSNVKECFKSQNEANVSEYLSSRGIEENSKSSMCVVVQKMLKPEMSGVIFTANPQGILNETVIVIGKGVGQNIVEDKVPTTTYYYNTDDEEYYFETQDDSPNLDKEKVDELISISKKIKEIFGEYMDIEFAIENNEIFILQARKITTINTDRIIVLDNSNITESYPNITLPFSQSFVREVYYKVMKSAVVRIAKNKEAIENIDSNLQNMVSFANGRAYYQISNWYGVLKLLPFNNKIIPIWQEMLGVDNKYVPEDEFKVPFSVKMNVVRSFFKLLKNTPKEMDKLDKFFTDVQQEYKDTFNENMTNLELIELYEKMKENIASRWDITLVNDMYTFIYTALLKRKVKSLNIENKEEYANTLISSIKDLASMKPIRELVVLSMYAKDAKLLDKLSEIKSNEDVEEYLNSCSDKNFVNMFREYIDKYGDRNVEELKIESKTFRTDPYILVQKIIEDIKDEHLEEYLETFKNKEENNTLVPHGVGKVLDKAKIGIRNREKSRLNRTRLYGIMRTISRTIGINLYKENVIDSPMDVYYLFYDELKEYVNTKNLNLKEIVALRKIEYEKYKALPNYSRLVFTDRIINKNPTNVNNELLDDSNTLQGIPCSIGKVEGDIVLVTNENIDNVDVTGKIILAQMTDPGWVYVISKCKGLIVEKGSILSHSAIISRELGKVAIVGVKNATKILKDNDHVILDATNGIVEVVKENV